MTRQDRKLLSILKKMRNQLEKVLRVYDVDAGSETVYDALQVVLYSLDSQIQYMKNRI